MHAWIIHDFPKVDQGMQRRKYALHFGTVAYMASSVAVLCNRDHLTSGSQ